MMKSNALFCTVTAITAGMCVIGCTPSHILNVSKPTRILMSKAQAPTVTSSRQVKVIGMRKFPYPYRAMLAISSDADHQTIRKFNLVHEFLNTTMMTPMGKGLGLDFSDSFFMYNGSDLPTAVDYGAEPLSRMMTYNQGVSASPRDAVLINHYIHIGWIDTMHTYGDFSLTNPYKTEFNRRLAIQAIRTLTQHGDRLVVWTDHGNTSNVDNFGSYGLRRFFDYQQGDNPRSPLHHTDVLVPYGIHFVWGDNWSAQFGHDTMIYPLALRDGRRIWGFSRYTSTGRTASGQVEWVWSPNDLDQELTLTNLQEIERNHQYAVVAQHMSGSNAKLPFSPSAISALKMLTEQSRSGEILVARTSRLLTYNVTQQFLRYHVTHDGGRAIIHLDRIVDPLFGSHRPSLDEVRGVTFYSSDPADTVMEIGNHLVPQSLIQYNKSDGVARSIGIRWYPSDTRNYVTVAAKTDGIHS